MDPMGEEQLDYEDEEYGGGQKLQFQGAGAISALAEEDLMGEDDEYDDLYNDVNVGEGFMQSLQQQSEPIVQFSDVGNGAEGLRPGPGSRVAESASSQEVTIPGVGVEGTIGKDPTVVGYSNLEQKKSGLLSDKNLEEGGRDYPDRGGVSQNQGSGGGLKIRVSDVAPQTQVSGGLGYRGPVPSIKPPGLGTIVGVDPGQVSNQLVSQGSTSMPDPGSSGIRGAAPTAINRMGMNRPMISEPPTRPMGGPVESGNTMLFVGELHWWTTDADLESVLSQYGRVKEIKFFDERASGKSKGYCQVEFFDAAAAAACKEGMNGHVFNGRACVVAFASPQTLRQMGAAYVNKTQAQAQAQQSQGRRPMNDVGGRGGGMNYQSGDGGRSYGARNYGRGGQGVLNKGPGGGMGRGRGAFGAKGVMGSGSGLGGGNAGGPYGQGLTGPPLGGPPGGLMHAMGAGFDPTYGAHMGRGAGYGGFSGPFPGMMPSFPVVNTVALPGVAPHVNPAFFGRGVSANGMGMMVSSGMDGNHAGMWTDTSMGGWGGEEHGRRTRESSYGDDVASDYGYGEASHERGGRSNASREKDRGSEHDWSGNSDRRHREEREADWDRSDRDRYRDDRDGYGDHRQRERDWDSGDDWDRGRSSSKSRSNKSRMLQEEDHRSRSKDTDYGKRRRLPSE